MKFTVNEIQVFNHQGYHLIHYVIKKERAASYLT